MSKDNKHTQGSPGDFEDKIDSAMAGLEEIWTRNSTAQTFMMKMTRRAILIPGRGKTIPMQKNWLSRILKRSIQRKKSTTRMMQS